MNIWIHIQAYSNFLLRLNGEIVYLDWFLVLIIIPYLKPTEDILSTCKENEQHTLSCASQLNWSACPVTCGHGIQAGVISVVCQNSHETTIWNNTLKRKCFIKPCSDQSGWSNWVQVGSCSVTCGKGFVTLFRNCQSAVLNDSGYTCFGKQFGLGFCTQPDCDLSTNIALGKDTRQSSTKCCNTTYVSKLAVDGKKLTNKIWKEPRCSHTNSDSRSWWAVDLADVYKISHVVIYGRTDCCGERLRNFHIEVIGPDLLEDVNWSSFQDKTSTLCYYQYDILPNHILNATCETGAMGKYLRIRLHETNPLTLCEVEVYGTFVNPVFSVQSLIDFGMDIQHSKAYQGSLIEAVAANDTQNCTSICTNLSSCQRSLYIQDRQECYILTT